MPPRSPATEIHHTPSEIPGSAHDKLKVQIYSLKNQDLTKIIQQHRTQGQMKDVNYVCLYEAYSKNHVCKIGQDLIKINQIKTKSYTH